MLFNLFLNIFSFFHLRSYCV